MGALSFSYHYFKYNKVVNIFSMFRVIINQSPCWHQVQIVALFILALMTATLQVGMLQMVTIFFLVIFKFRVLFKSFAFVKTINTTIIKTNR